ncbi:unnamed protein product [Rotaria sp. Silwood1]|nr:unnamed protein product [Rotaria sp. Silwood1]
MCDRFNRNSCQRDVQITIDPGYSGVAYTLGRIIVISAKWLRDNPQDTDVITHEGMHVVQGYPRYDPSWLVEGIADYSRWKYGINNPAGGWSLPNFVSSQYYTNSYRITARFLAWCEKFYPNIVNQLDAAMRNNVYSADSWKQFASGKCGTNDHFHSTKYHSRGTSDHFRGTTCHSLGTSDHFRGTKYHSRGTADHFHSTKVPLWWYRGPFILHNWPFSLYR